MPSLRSASTIRLRIGGLPNYQPPLAAPLGLPAFHGCNALATHGTTSPRCPGSGTACFTAGRGLWMQVRGKKTKTKVELQNLPQGPLTAANLPPAEGEELPAYPTVLLQARRNMLKFDNCVLLTRVGGFYELYFEHADEYGPLLNIKVAQRRTNAGNVSMAGFPFFQLDRFLKILVQDLNCYVAIAEEFPNDASKKIKSGGLMHDRQVARVVTPGTLIDENFMDPYSNNYVMAIHLSPTTALDEAISIINEKEPIAKGRKVKRSRTVPGIHAAESVASTSIGLAWLDLSTGKFYTQTTSLTALNSVLSRVTPREVILDKELQANHGHVLTPILAEDKHLITYSPRGDLLHMSDWVPMLEADISADIVQAITHEEVEAGNLLLNYVKDRLPGLSIKLQPPVRHESVDVMNLDKNSMRALEIKQTIRDGAFRGSLLHAIRRTVTKSGARLLHEWLSAPSTSLDIIHFRQELVSRFLHDEDLRKGIVFLLRLSHDSQRLVQKFALNRGDADDLLRLASTIKATEDIVALLRDSVALVPIKGGEDCLVRLINRISLEEPVKLAAQIRDAVDEDGLVKQHELEDGDESQMVALAEEVVQAEGEEADGALLPKNALSKAKKKPVSLRDHYGEDTQAWVMRQGASSRLSRLHSELETLVQNRSTLTDDLRTRLQAPSLTLKWSPSLGHTCHVKGKDARTPAVLDSDDNKTSAIRTLSSSRSTRTFQLREWTALGEHMDAIRMQIRQEEARVFACLRQKVVQNLIRLRRNAVVLDELDITTSFACLAAEQHLIRPVVNESNTHTIIAGRHPTVEAGLAEQGRSFQPNDCILGAGPQSERIWLVTGPNMAGKSTFLRQNALITVLAQVGSYVPAAHAEIGVVDALYTRVGSADNLYHNQSTFMVEMLETAAILQRATPRSLVIMDEIGRGTTPEDGTAVAFASLHHLVHVNRCRALFATHFHAIADLAAERQMRAEDGGVSGVVGMYCTDVAENAQGGFVYVHKLQRGINRNSHALKVARLAGLPEMAVQVARQVIQGKSSEMAGEDRHQPWTAGREGQTTGYWKEPKAVGQM